MSASTRVSVVATPEDVAAQALGLVLGAERRAIADHGAFRIALAGGTTPRRLYELLAESQLADFGKWHVFFGDERWVGPDHPGSNWRMARETLLERAGIPSAQIHPIDTTAGSPEKAARLYAMTLVRKLAPAPGEMPRLDMVLLGLGADGHTASLFPGADALEAGGEPVIAARAPAPFPWRVTMTPGLINAARAVVFLAAGEDKAEALSRLIDGGEEPRPPAARIHPLTGELRFVVDAAAASRLRRQT